MFEALYIPQQQVEIGKQSKSVSSDHALEDFLEQNSQIQNHENKSELIAQTVIVEPYTPRNYLFLPKINFNQLYFGISKDEINRVAKSLKEQTDKYGTFQYQLTEPIIAGILKKSLEEYRLLKNRHFEYLVVTAPMVDSLGKPLPPVKVYFSKQKLGIGVAFGNEYQIRMYYPPVLTENLTDPFTASAPAVNLVGEDFPGGFQTTTRVAQD